MLFRVTDHPNLVKDSKSKAILNTDISAVKRHEERIAKVNKELQRERDIEELRTNMNEMKGLMRALLEKMNG